MLLQLEIMLATTTAIAIPFERATSGKGLWVCVRVCVNYEK